MSHQIKGVNLTRGANPIAVGLAVVGLAVAAVGQKTARITVLGIGALIYGIGVLMIAKPSVSALLGVMGLGGGFIQFFLLPQPDMQGTGLATRLLATLLFSSLYLILMDTLLLVVAFLYNVFVGTIGFDGIRLELGEDEETEEAS